MEQLRIKATARGWSVEHWYRDSDGEWVPHLRYRPRTVEALLAIIARQPAKVRIRVRA